MPNQGGYPTTEVLQAEAACLRRIARVHERLEYLEAVVKRCERQRLPFFRESLGKAHFTFHVSVRNLLHELAALTKAMMPTHTPKKTMEPRRIVRGHPEKI